MTRETRGDALIRAVYLVLAKAVYLVLARLVVNGFGVSLS